MRPEIQLQKFQVFKKGMKIDCKLNRANPSEVTYTWYSCGTAICDKSNAEWNFESRNSSLRIKKQAVSEMRYRCVARNTAGQDQAETTVLFKSSNSKHWYQGAPLKEIIFNNTLHNRPFSYRTSRTESLMLQEVWLAR